jgi:hypothetical protein
MIASGKQTSHRQNTQREIFTTRIPKLLPHSPAKTSPPLLSIAQSPESWGLGILPMRQRKTAKTLLRV